MLDGHLNISISVHIGYDALMTTVVKWTFYTCRARSRSSHIRDSHQDWYIVRVHNIDSIDQNKYSPRSINTDHWELFTYDRMIGMYASSQILTYTALCTYQVFQKRVLFSKSVVRIGSAFMQLIVIFMCDIELGSNIFQCEFTHNTQIHGISLNYSV